VKHSIPYLAVAVILCYAFYNATVRKLAVKKPPHSTPISYRKDIKTHEDSKYEEELARLHTDSYTQEYIIHIINHGSTQLHFKEHEVMDAGFASKEDAPKIACYVMSFSGKRCKEPYPKDAVMFYTSICGGCHGNDGRGMNGTYPDLTRSQLLGIAKREAFLKSILHP
jgi:hypothetical protein